MSSNRTVKIPRFRRRVIHISTAKREKLNLPVMIIRTTRMTLAVVVIVRVASLRHPPTRTTMMTRLTLRRSLEQRILENKIVDNDYII